MLEYSRTSRDDLAAVVEFIGPLNVKADHRIGYLGDRPEEIARELLKYGAIDVAFMARQNGQLVGFMATDVDEDLGRSYLFGPWVDVAEWDEIASRLVDECIALVPDNARKQLEMFFDIANDNVSRLGSTLGLETYKEVRTLRFDRSDLDNVAPGTAIPVATRHHESVMELHDRTFPNTHLPGRRMLEELGDNKACFVRSESDEVLGYIYLEVDNTTGSASLEFLGSAERARRRGIAADLVQAGLHWTFGFESLSKTWLVVDEDNEDAREALREAGVDRGHRLTSMRLRVARKPAGSPGAGPVKHTTVAEGTSPSKISSTGNPGRSF
jgi:RimJ/RimL family protein N-acetyltransferase